MILSEPRKVLFVHIQKTGGTTVQRMLKAHLPGAHDFLGTHDQARYAKAALGPAYGTYFKFAFVRNPWDRLVSWYSMIVQKAPRLTPAEAARPDSRHNRLWHYVLSNSNTFEEFIRNCTATIDDIDGRKSFCSNQLDYVTDEEGRMIVDEICRFESFDADGGRMLARLGIPAVLPKDNPSEHRHYTEYYTAETRDIVAERYRRDIEHFGYTFGG